MNNLYALLLLTGFTLAISLLILVATDIIKMTFKENPNNKVIKMLEKTIGIEVCRLTKENKKEIIEKLNFEIEEFVDSWEPGDKTTISFDYEDYDLIPESFGLEEQVEELCRSLDRITGLEQHIDFFEVEIDEVILEEIYKRKTTDWEREVEEQWSNLFGRGV